jgi:hypothetical protein
MEFLNRGQLVKGGVYAIRSRNLSVGVYDGDDGFVGIRKKFNERYLFTEYLARNCGGTQLGLDTVYPKELLDTLPEGLEIKERDGLWCDTCGQRGYSDKTKSWPESDSCDGGCGKPDLRWKSNQPLFDFLDSYEDRDAEQQYIQSKRQELRDMEKRA